MFRDYDKDLKLEGRVLKLMSIYTHKSKYIKQHRHKRAIVLTLTLM